MGRESKEGAVGQMRPWDGEESRRRRKMGSWNVSGEAAGAGWRIEGTADATGRGGEGENGEMESEGEEDGKLAMEDGR